MKPNASLRPKEPETVNQETRVGGSRQVFLQHIGVVVRDLEGACERYNRIFGLQAQDFRTDQGGGMQRDARILLGNDCWLHLVENWDPQSRVNKFLQARGEGLEHFALQTTSIEQDVSRITEAGVPIDEGQIFEADDGFEAFVLAEHLPGHTIELIQPHATSWSYPSDLDRTPVSTTMGIVRLQHLGVVVRDLAEACERYNRIFGLQAQDFRTDQGGGMQRDARILLGNDCWLHLVENWDPQSRVNKFLQARGEGLEHFALQTTSIEQDVSRITEAGVPIDEGQIFEADDGFEAFVLAEHLPGHTIELIQPHATSWA